MDIEKQKTEIRRILTEAEKELSVNDNIEFLLDITNEASGRCAKACADREIIMHRSGLGEDV